MNLEHVKEGRKFRGRGSAWLAGNVSILFGITLPAVVGVCGLGADVGYWYYQERNLQSAADAAAYDGIIALKGGGSTTTITTEATNGATSNGWSSTGGTITVNSPPTSGNYQNAYSVQVTLTQNLPRFFSGLYSRSQVPASASSVATMAGGYSCVLALNATANQAIDLSGSTNLSTNCDVVADSNSSSAINMSGSAQATVPCAVTVGTADTTSGLTLTKCTSVTTHAPSVADPYASVSQPTGSGLCKTVPSNATDLYEGWYCSGLVTSWGPITFHPGTYVVTGGSLQFQAGTIASGTNVTFFVGAGYTLAVSGSATVVFSAPTTGTYAGILFFGDRTATSGNNSFSGSSLSSITGAVYFPTQTIVYSGSASSGAACTQLVGGIITISGSANFTHNCSGDGMNNIAVADGRTGSVRLAE